MGWAVAMWLSWGSVRSNSRFRIGGKGHGVGEVFSELI